MANYKKRLDSGVLRTKIATNLILGILVVSVGSLCLSATDTGISADGNEIGLYRSAGEDGVGVSLMFNVYWGTDEVYRILQTLKSHEATATFFIGGCWADDNVDCVKEIVARGHELGNHGYFHKSHDKLTEQQNREEILRCNQFLSLAVGVDVTLFAPPSGAYADATLTAAKRLGMKTVLWTKDTVDWRDKDAKTVYKRATDGVTSGSLVLMHPMEHTVKALPDVLKEYKRRGLSAITVGENLGG